MPTIAEAVGQLMADAVPALCVDTCVLLDIVRSPQRQIAGCIQSAMTLADLQSRSACRVIASSMIQSEWSAHEQSVVDELDRFLDIRDRDALAFHDACALVNIALSFGKPTYRAVSLSTRLRELAAQILSNAIHLSTSTEAKTRATDRTLARKRPAQKGGGLQDCVILEEYLELSLMLQQAGFPQKRVFCSTNSSDYQDGSVLHGSLVDDFSSTGLVFTNALHWAVNELKTP